MAGMRPLPVYFSVRIEPGCDTVGPKSMSSVERPVNKPRPVYLSLLRIRLPLPGSDGTARSFSCARTMRTPNSVSKRL